MEDILSHVTKMSPKPGFPKITLTYAQSLDGSIARDLEIKKPLALSCAASMLLTHRLRAIHDGILVGVNTVLSDDPSLTTRLCDGPSPRPIILDSSLKCPVTAKICSRKPIIICVGGKWDDPKTHRAKLLEAAGAQILPCDAQDKHHRPKLSEAFAMLRSLFSITNLMIEGGAAVIRSMLEEALADVLVITVAPMFVGGLVPTQRKRDGEDDEYPRVNITSALVLGSDVIVMADYKAA